MRPMNHGAAVDAPPAGPAAYPDHVVCPVWGDPERPHEWRGGLDPAQLYAPPERRGPAADPYIARRSPLYRRMRRDGASAHAAGLTATLEFVRAREGFPSIRYTEDVLLGVFGRRDGGRALGAFLRIPNAHDEQLQEPSRTAVASHIRDAWNRRHG